MLTKKNYFTILQSHGELNHFFGVVSSGHLGQYLVLPDAYLTVDSRLHPNALPNLCSHLQRITKQVDAACHVEKLLIDRVRLHLVSKCLEYTSDLHGDANVHLHARTKNDELVHFCCACHSASAATTPAHLGRCSTNESESNKGLLFHDRNPNFASKCW